MGDIAAAIGCSVGTFYTRFHNKEAYFDVLLGLVTELMQQRADAFLDDEQAPDTVNPSLWRLARLNRLFQVSAHIFQVRGFDIANITFIETDNGVIALNALTCPETAAGRKRRFAMGIGLPQNNRPGLSRVWRNRHTGRSGWFAATDCS